MSDESNQKRAINVGRAYGMSMMAAAAAALAAGVPLPSAVDEGAPAPPKASGAFRLSTRTPIRYARGSRPADPVNTSREQARRVRQMQRLAEKSARCATGATEGSNG